MRHIHRLALTACLTALLALGATQPGKAELVKGYPDALVCEVPKGKIVIYLHTVRKDGSAIYMEQGGDFATLKKDGTIVRNNKPIESCTKHMF